MQNFHRRKLEQTEAGAIVDVRGQEHAYGSIYIPRQDMQNLIQLSLTPVKTFQASCSKEGAPQSLLAMPCPFTGPSPHNAQCGLELQAARAVLA
jgi:hypothetical protein